MRGGRAGGWGGKWEEGRGGPALQASVEGPPTSALLVPCRERRGCYKELKTSENITMHQNKEPPPPRAAREIKGRIYAICYSKIFLFANLKLLQLILLYTICCSNILLVDIINFDVDFEVSMWV